MTSASKITVFRILLIPAFMAAMLLDFPHARLLALGIFILANLTDIADGFIARKYDQVSNFGKFMDPLADKLLMASAMLIFVQWGRMPAWVVMIVLTREFAVSGLRMMAAANGTVIAAGMSGKVKTVITFFALCWMMTPFYHWTIAGEFTADNLAVALILITTLYSGIEYFMKNRKVLTAE